MPNKTLAHTKLSILDLTPYNADRTIADALHASRALAQLAESLGYERFWVAEHHSIDGVASAATAVVIGYIAEGTKKIRVGSGGIMLPNHAPIVVAEQFGTLESLYPNRIDLGLGRAPGSDRMTMMAMRRGTELRGGEFDQLIEELEFFFAKAEPGQKVKAIPGEGLNIPLYILGSSTYSAHLAAKLGRPYAFAGHFAPGAMTEAFDIYRREFQPSKHLRKPYVMVGVPIIAAETDREAERQATSLYQVFLNMVRGNPRLSHPPIDSMDGVWNPMEEAHVRNMLQLLIVGGPERIKQGLQSLIDLTGADEVILSANFYDDKDRRKGFEIIAKAAGLKADGAIKNEMPERTLS